MKRKILLGSLLGLAISISAFAQDNLGIDYLRIGELQLAKDYFTKNMQQAPAESSYYLGEIAYEQGNMAEAKANFDKGLAADALNPLNAVGEAKLMLKSDFKTADHQLNDLKKKNKKKVDVLVEIAKAYADNGLNEEALDRIHDARKADKKSPYTYMLEGDMLYKQNKAGEAAQQYDQAIYFDPNCVTAYIKGARIYETINPQTSIDMMNKGLQAKPDFAIIYKYLGDLYNRHGAYQKAVEAYQNFHNGGTFAAKDYAHYAASQYYLQKYPEAISICQEGLKLEPDNFYVNRFLMYSYNQNKNYTEGLDVAKHFFSLTLDPKDSTQRYAYEDYSAYANLLAKNKDVQGALVQYKKAISLDSSNVELYKTIAKTCSDSGLSGIAGDFYGQYISKLDTAQIQPADYYQQGLYYYSGGSETMQDSTATDQDKQEAMAFLVKADSAFSSVIKRAPKEPIGYLFRARVHAAMDPTMKEGAAKPYFETLIAKVTEFQQNPKVTDAQSKAYHNDLLEAYNYLVPFYYNKWAADSKTESMQECKEVTQKLLDIDPTNPAGTQLMTAIQGIEKQLAAQKAAQKRKASSKK